MEATTELTAAPTPLIYAPPRLNEIAAALAKAQAKMSNPKKSRTVKVRTTRGDNYSYSYAELDTIIEHVRLPLAENGLSVVQFTTVQDARLLLVTRLLHASGQYLESTYPLPSGAGAQEMGSAITYGRRYCLGAMLFLAAEDDEDGKLASDGQGGQQDRDTLINLMGEASLGNKAVMDYCRAQKLGDGRTTEDLSDEAVRKLVDTWPAASAAMKAAPKAAPVKSTPVEPAPAAKQEPTAKMEELPDLPDLTGLDTALAAGMAKAGVSKAQLKAYYVGAKHMPASMDPEKLPKTYLTELLKPDNWAKAVEAMKKQA